MSLYHIWGRELLSSSFVSLETLLTGRGSQTVSKCLYQPDLDYISSMGLWGPFCLCRCLPMTYSVCCCCFFFFSQYCLLYHLLSSIQISWFGLNFSLYFQNISPFLHFFWDMGENSSGRHTICCCEVIFLSLAFTFSCL